MKNLQRVLCLFLCLSVLLFATVRPVQVSANTATGQMLIDVSTSLGDTAQVIPAVFLVMLVLQGLGWYYSHIDEIVFEAERILNTSTAAVQNWANEAAKKIENGSKVIRLNKSVKTDLNMSLEPSGKKIPDGVAYVIAGLVLTKAFDKVESDEVLVDTSSAVLQSIESVLVQINSSIQLMSTEVTSGLQAVQNESSLIYKQMNNRFIAMQEVLRDTYSLIHSENTTILSSISNLHGMLHADFSLLRTNLSDLYILMEHFFDSPLYGFDVITTGIQEIPAVLGSQIANLSTSIQEFPNVLGQKIDGLTSSVQELSFDYSQKIDSLFTSIQEIPNNLGQKIDGLTSTVKELISPSNKPIEEVLPNYSSAVDIAAAENQLVNDSSNGLQLGLSYVGGTSTLAELYTIPFLCVIALFKPFADLPLFDALLKMSLGLAVCAIILNIGLEVAKSNSSKVKNSSKFKKNRGGTYASI